MIKTHTSVTDSCTISYDNIYRLCLHGNNIISIDVKSYPRLFVEEVCNIIMKISPRSKCTEQTDWLQVLHPFYLFQLCSVLLWFLDDYYVYSSCIFVISAISIVVSLYETKKQSVTLANMVKSPDTTVTVIKSDGSAPTVPLLLYVLP